MRNMKLYDNHSPAVFAAGSIMAASAMADMQQDGSGMHSGMMGSYGMGWMGGYGGIWVAILLVAVFAGLVGWLIAKKRK